MNVGHALDAFHILLPKQGSTAQECEDAYSGTMQGERFAIADGATEAFDSKWWANLLARSWSRVDPPALSREDFQPFIRDLALRLDRRWATKTMPWWAFEKAALGSFAAFLGIQFAPGTEIVLWDAIALGDCCLVHQRQSTLIAAFPIDDPGDFGYHPTLLPSLVSLQPLALDSLKVAHGLCHIGDEILLLSDAVAAWCFDGTAKGEERRAAICRGLRSRDSAYLIDLIRSEQQRGQMRNDDVVAVRIAICPPTL